MHEIAKVLFSSFIAILFKIYESPISVYVYIWGMKLDTAVFPVSITQGYASINARLSSDKESLDTLYGLFCLA